jgi:hypothetical protein
MSGIGDGPIDPKLRDLMNSIAAGLDDVLNGEAVPGVERIRQNGFVVMIFPFEGFDGRCNYISNAKREDIVTLLKEQIARFEGQPEQQGTA